MKTRINLTLSDENIMALDRLSMLTGKSKSSMVDELLDTAKPILEVSAELVRKSQHLRRLSDETLRNDIDSSLKAAEKAQTELHNVIVEIDKKINRKLAQINRRKTPVSNTGVQK